MTARMVLRAVGQAARMSGSRYVHFGTRSLSIGAGVDHTTVAAHLRALREGPDALIELIDGNRGVDGDLYELVIPARYADRAGRRDWRGGKLHALRPVFLELGIPAALVYEALEYAKEPLTSFDLTASVGLSRSAVYEAGNARRVPPRRAAPRPVGPQRVHQPHRAGRAARRHRDHPPSGGASPT